MQTTNDLSVEFHFNLEEASSVVLFTELIECIELAKHAAITLSDGPNDSVIMLVEVEDIVENVTSEVRELLDRGVGYIYRPAAQHGMAVNFKVIEEC